jgi:integrase
MSRINQDCVDQLMRHGAPAKVSVCEQSLYLCVRGPGKGYWVHQYREPGTGKLRGIGFGSASKVTLASALKARRRFDPKNPTTWPKHRREALENGTVRTPRATSTEVAGVTFTAALAAWLDRDGKQWSAKGVKARRGLARLDGLASKDIAAITQDDVLVALAGETPRQHQDKRGWLADLFSFAKTKGWRTGDNPARFDRDTVRGFERPVKDHHHHAAVPWAELPGLYRALPDNDIGRALRFQILTAARPGAVEKATWGQIQGDNGTSSWVYLIHKGKGRNKEPREFRQPLSRPALALLGERGKPDEKIFGKLPRNNALLNAAKAVRPDATAHGMRAAFKTWCQDTGKDDILSDIAMSHLVRDEIWRAYARSDLIEKRRELMENWAAFALS